MTEIKMLFLFAIKIVYKWRRHSVLCKETKNDDSRTCAREKMSPPITISPDD